VITRVQYVVGSSGTAEISGQKLLPLHPGYYGICLNMYCSYIVFKQSRLQALWCPRQSSITPIAWTVMYYTD